MPQDLRHSTNRVFSICLAAAQEEFTIKESMLLLFLLALSIILGSTLRQELSKVQATVKYSVENNKSDEYQILHKVEQRAVSSST